MSNNSPAHRLVLRRILGIGTAMTLAMSLGAAGCNSKQAAAPPQAPLSVPVSVPVQRQITDYADYTARIYAVNSVEVRAHVWGYLERVNFTEGTLVKKGDVLCELDPRQYQAQFDASKAQLALSEASIKLASSNNRRYKELQKNTPGSVSLEELDKYQATEDQAVANVALAKAQVESAELNLKWTKVITPISGRVSRYAVTVGNLITAGDQGGGTLLTTIVSVDPVHAYFDVDELTIQHVRQSAQMAKLSASEKTVPVSLGLAAEVGFPHQGTIDFADNQVNAKTGTLRVRAIFPNKGDTLTPGFFSRVRVPVSPLHPALLISDRALDSDQGQKILYIVNEKNEVVTRAVRTGRLHDGLREITEGLKPDDRIIIGSLQQIRPGITVEPKLAVMPNSTAKNNRETSNLAIVAQ